MFAIFVSMGRSKQIELDRFGHQNGSARWRCPKMQAGKVFVCVRS
jgi:hypothetical protein